MWLQKTPVRALKATSLHKVFVHGLSFASLQGICWVVARASLPQSTFDLYPLRTAADGTLERGSYPVRMWVLFLKKNGHKILFLAGMARWLHF